MFDQKLSLKARINAQFAGESSSKKKKQKISDAQTFEELHVGEIDHIKSKHTMMLQRSEYLSLEECEGCQIDFTEEQLADPFLMAKREQ